jgi:hypothetical protein
MADYLFDTPWWLPLSILAVGLYVFITGNRRQERNVMLAGGGIALLAVAIMGISYLVETNREMAVNRTEGMVDAVNARDWTRFKSLIDRETVVANWKGADEITAAARDAAERFQIGKIRISGTTIEEHQTAIAVSIRVFTDVNGRTVPSDWLFDYQNRGTGWKLYSVTLGQAPGRGDDRVREFLNGR